MREAAVNELGEKGGVTAPREVVADVPGLTADCEDEGFAFAATGEGDGVLGAGAELVVEDFCGVCAVDC